MKLFQIEWLGDEIIGVCKMSRLGLFRVIPFGEKHNVRLGS
jgi:hypothetical protein